MTNLMAGKTEYFVLCFLSCIFKTCAVFVKSNFSRDRKLIKLPPGERLKESHQQKHVICIKSLCMWNFILSKCSAGFSAHMLVENKLSGLCVEIEHIIIPS